MSEHDEHHQHHKAEHDHERKEKKHHEREREQHPERLKPLIHPMWFYVLGIVLLLGVVFVWIKFN